jgi:hypothetical protein
VPIHKLVRISCSQYFLTYRSYNRLENQKYFNNNIYKMEEAILEMKNLVVYFDYLHKTPWIWGGSRRMVVVSSDQPILRRYFGFCSMAFLNFVYCGCVVYILLRLLLSSSAEDVSVEGTLFLLVGGCTGIYNLSFSYVMLVHSQIMGNTLVGLQSRKGKT